MKCKNKVIQFIPNGYGYRQVPSQCGTTGIHGELLLCDECLARAEKEFPQGWNLVPGDTCKHGRYIGEPGGPDILCPDCEME